MTTQDEKNYGITVDLISKVTALPIVRVNRREFLVKEFPNVDASVLLEKGPLEFYTPEELREKAYKLVESMTNKTAMASFATGFGSSPITAVAAGGADVMQYFGSALNMAQKIVYILGEADLFDKENKLNEESRARLITYLGVMLGAAGATALIRNVSVNLAKSTARTVVKTAVTKTAWYPILKKVGALVGVKITKKSLEKSVTKVVPILGAVASGALTYVSYKPMGKRLVDGYVDNALKVNSESETVKVDDENVIDI